MKEIFEALGLPETATLPEVLAAIEQLKAGQPFSRVIGFTEAALREKMAAGLTLDQAMEVLEKQEAHDATNPHDDATAPEAEAVKAKKPTKPKNGK